MRTFLTSVVLALVTALAGCTTGPESPKGFSLPKGDAQRGQHMFVRMECTACHTVSGVELPDPDETLNISLMLGGEVRQIKTYADLVTSIINPSHKITTRYAEKLAKKGEVSKMPIYNDLLTVTDLIDIVAFLEPRYKLQPYSPTGYRPF